MTYETFKQTVLCRLAEDIPDPKRILIRPVFHNNGEHLDGLVILEGGGNIGPTLYLNSYYERLRDGVRFPAVYRQIMDSYEQNKTEKHVDVGFFTDFSRIRERILPKLIHCEKNRELLEESVPHIPFLDLAIVFTCMFPVDPDIGNATILIDNSHQALWGVSAEELYAVAMENARRKLPPRLMDINRVLADLAEEAEDVPPLPEEDDPHFPMYVLTNGPNLFGAACMAYDGLMDQYAEELGSGFYILPSSIHELILVPSRENTRMAEFSRMVQDVNTTQVEPEDVLSDHAYYYSPAEAAIVY